METPQKAEYVENNQKESCILLRGALLWSYGLASRLYLILRSHLPHTLAVNMSPREEFPVEEVAIKETTPLDNTKLGSCLVRGFPSLIELRPCSVRASRAAPLLSEAQLAPKPDVMTGANIFIKSSATICQYPLITRHAL